MLVLAWCFTVTYYNEFLPSKIYFRLVEAGLASYWTELINLSKLHISKAVQFSVSYLVNVSQP